MARITTSPSGIAFLERHEGVVLKAYRDVVGVWTIGAGLTAASGVVKPSAGMVITNQEASRLLALALERNYEPSVRRAMPGANRHEFDGGSSFHFNTGAIGRASWVDAWRKKDRVRLHDRIMLWVKGGGKVLPGLKRRREEESRLIRDGVYGPTQSLPKIHPGYAKITVRLSTKELAAARAGFQKLGYAPGSDARFIAIDAVMRFQGAHDLTADGIIGRATLTTLQRRLDLRRKVGATTVAGGASATGTQASAAADLVAHSDMITIAIIAVIGLVLIYQAWRYRDGVAAKINQIAPRTAAKLRNI